MLCMHYTVLTIGEQKCITQVFEHVIMFALATVEPSSIPKPHCTHRFQGMRSPVSSVKETCHDAVKYTWFCVLCKAFSRNYKVITFAKCVDDATKHRLVESAVFCKRCHELGDDLDLMKRSPCPKPLTFEGEKDVAKQHDKSLPVSKPAADMEKATTLRSQIEKAEKEMKRLEILKVMAEERQRLAELMAQKTKSCFLLACNYTTLSRITYVLRGTSHKRICMGRT